MTPVIIGISSGLLIILVFVMLKQFDKKLIYGLILCGIGFLYVGFAWSDTRALAINSAQAVLFSARYLGFTIPHFPGFRFDPAGIRPVLPVN